MQSRYDYNPMRYNFDNVPFDMSVSQPEAACINTVEISFENKKTNKPAPKEELLSLRMREYYELLKLYEDWQLTFAFQKSTSLFLHGEESSQSYLTAYGEKLKNFGKYIDFLSPEEYAKTFKELTGMDIEEYRAEKKKNPNFKLNWKNIADTKRKNAHINITEDSVDYGREKVISFTNNVVNQKSKNLSEARKEFYKETEKENAWNRDLNDICDLLHIGTSKEKAKKEFFCESENIIKMEKAIADGDLEDFAVQFKNITGNDFRVKNFIELKKAQEKYLSAKDDSPEKEQLKKDLENAFETAYGKNIPKGVFESYVLTKKVSEGVTKGIAIAGATVLTGGIAGAAGAAVSGGVLTAGATTTTATVAGTVTSAVITTTAASAASAGYDYIANKTGNGKNQVETGKNAAEIAAYTTEAQLATGAGKIASKYIPGGWGKALGIVLEIGADTGASYGISKFFDHDTSFIQEGTISAASGLIPRAAALCGGAKNIRSAQKRVNQQVMMNLEGVDKKFVDMVKKERPHLSDDMAIEHAKRLQRVSEGKTPWQEGPVSDYDKVKNKKFYRTQAGQEDFIAQAKKIAKPEDKLLPVQKREFTQDEIDVIETYYSQGTSHFSEDEYWTIENIIRNSKPLDDDYIVYRTISSDRGSAVGNAAFIDEIKEGTIITSKNLTSTATEYDFACLQFHPDYVMNRSGGKGYVMRIKLPKGTKGIDLRATKIEDGLQSEFILPPNSQIKVTKVDHINQILECDYILPKTEDYMPRDNMKMTLSHKPKISTDGDVLDDVITETVIYPDRKISYISEYEPVRKDITIDTTIRPDGSTVEVRTDYESSAFMTKTIKNKKGKVIFKDTIIP